MNWKLLAVCLLITLSGCTVVDQPGHSNSLAYSGDLNSSGDVFIMDGYLYQDGTNAKTLSNVSVCGYTESGELLFAEPVPPFKVKQDIMIRNDREPHYIIPHSDEFWGSGTFSPFDEGKIDTVWYWESYESGGYRSKWTETKDDLPIDAERPLQNGCPA